MNLPLSEIVLLRPGWLSLLLPWMWLVWRWWRRPTTTMSPWASVVSAHLLPHLVMPPAAARRRATAAITVLCGGALAILALAGPARPGDRPAWQASASRVLVVDLSPPSAVTPVGDEAPLDRMRRVAASLIAALPPGRIGLVIYGGEPYQVVPLTTDRNLPLALLPELDPAIIPVPGARPELALSMAQRMVEKGGGEDGGGGDIIWLTADRVPPAAPLSAPTPGVRVSVIHLGRDRGAGWEVWTAAREGVFVAGETAPIRPLLDRLGQAAVRSAEPLSRGMHDVGGWLLLPLLLLAALAFRRGALPVAPPGLLVLIALTFLPGHPAEAQNVRDDRAAWAHASRGEWSEAAQRFADPNWLGVARYRAGDYTGAAAALATADDPLARHNLGNALARSGRYAEAVAAYEASLARRDNPDTRFNLELVRRLLNPPQADSPSSVPPSAAPPSGKPPQGGGKAPSSAEADRVAEQWLRGVSDEPQTLLARRLQQEHARRQAGRSLQRW